MCVFVALLTIGLSLPRVPLEIPELVLGVFYEVVLLLALIVVATRDGLGVHSLTPTWNWNKWDTLWMIAILLISYLGHGIYMYLARAPLPTADWWVRLILEFKSMRPPVFALVAGSYALLIGIAEELVFRSYLITRLRHLGYSQWVCVLFSGMSFGLLHALDQGIHAAISIALFTGIPMGIYFYRRGKIIPLIALHAFIDLVAFTAMYLLPLSPGPNQPV